jgi:type I restriction enzyme S subunit
MDTEQKVSELGLANSAAVLHPTETVMVSRTASIGFACRIGRPMATTQAFIAWTPGPEVDSRYLLLVVKAMKSEFDRLAHGSTHLTIYMPDIEGLKMPLPPLETQRAIADTLDVETSRLDALIDKKRRMVRLLEESFSSWVFAEVTGREAGQQQPSTLAWVDWIPSAWRSVPLRYAARLGTGHTPSRTHPEYWVDCNVPWISLFDVGAMRDPFTEVTSTTKQRISDLGLANSSAVLHAAGTVVLSRTASVGFATIMGNAMAVSQHFVTWTCGEDLLPEYLLYVLRAMRQEWESLQVGTTNVTVFMPDLYAVRIPLPPLMEQEQIVARIRRRRESVRQLVSALESQVSLLVEHRQAIITAAVTGEIDVPWAAA